MFYFWFNDLCTIISEEKYIGFNDLTLDIWVQSPYTN